MSQKKRQSLFDKLAFDKVVNDYRCQHPLAGTTIEVFVCVPIDAERGTLQTLAEKTEALFDEWSTLRKTILKAAQAKLVSFGRLEQGAESKVTLDSLIPTAVQVFHDSDVPPYFCFRFDIPGVLDELESLDYFSDFDRTYAHTEINFEG